MRLVQIFILTIIHAVVLAQRVTPQKEAAELIRLLREKHVEPRVVDDDFALRVWNNLLTETDPDFVFFTAEEVSGLRALSTSIDNDLQTGKWEFFPAYIKVYTQCLERAIAMVQNYGARQPELNKPENYSIDTTWALDQTELSERWRLMLKSEMLHELAENPKNSTVDQSSLMKQEPVIRERIVKRKLRSINRIYKNEIGREPFLESVFLKSVSAAFDPHSEYMSSAQMENFIGRLRTEGYFFGFALHENELGQMSVTNIVPGEPAWKSGVLSVGDVIERLRWEGKEWVDITGITQEELDFIFAESNSATMELSIRKPDGEEKTLKLKKEKHNDEFARVRGFVLTGKKTIGYIGLPNFYSDFSTDEGIRSANDVAKEIIKLKQHNIEGVILDLRFNGGGSLREAVEMAGNFIDVGPVGVEKGRGTEPLLLRDFNRGTIFDGPLVIMVNGTSASASEIFAAAMQDYNRAIIVGSPTFGKAVAQEMFSLEPGRPEIDFEHISAKRGFGFSSITTSRIYRVNGRSIQKYGVTPDILLPEVYSTERFRENQLPFALSPDSISRKTYFQPRARVRVSDLRGKSEARIKSHPGFTSVIAYSEHLKATSGSSTEILDWAHVQTSVANDKKIYAEMTELTSKEVAAFKVSLHDYGKLRSNEDRYGSSVTGGWIKNLSKDIAVEEAFQIICDQIDMNKED